MKVAVEWLNEYLSPKLGHLEMAAALERMGIEVEQIISSNKLDSKMIVAEVKKVIQHPQADKLKLVELSLGKAKIIVVCGASNVAPGQKVALAQVGAELPDGTKINPVDIRGATSNGMVCSAAELGLGDDQGGILVLSEEFSVGQKLCDLWPEQHILDLATPANRPDALSVIGLAREVTAVNGLRLKLPPVVQHRSGKGKPVVIKFGQGSATNRYMAAKLAVKNSGQSPDWLQRRLLAGGLRPINPVVDVTNYVMLEYGQPVHAFDADKISLPLKVRPAKAGEKLTTLDGEVRKLTDKDVVIADAKGAVALAGVMGGASSEITAETKNVIIECANFEGSTIRKMAQRQAARSEASARFERGLPVQLAPVALDRVLDLLFGLAKAKLAAPPTDLLAVWPWVQHVGVRASRVSNMLGMKLSRAQIVEHLRRLEFAAEQFDIVAEAKKHLGKPYKWGAKFKTDGTKAFDCSYLTDYIYSLIGIDIGHVSYAQFEHGRPVHTGELQPGDLLFHGSDDPLRTDDRHGVTHCVLSIGDGQIIHAKSGRGVIREPVETVMNHPEYRGARRYVENLEDYVAVTVPWWRPDIKTEQDVAEELIRLVGYEEVPATIPAWRPTAVEFDHIRPAIDKVQVLLQSLGLFELISYSFVSSADLKTFGLKLSDHLKLKNPRSQEQAYLRSNLLPSLVSMVARNQTYSAEFGGYEISRVFRPQAPGKLPAEPTLLGMVGRTPRDAYWQAKGVLDALAAGLHLDFGIQKSQFRDMHPGRAAKVILDGKVIGRIGEIHPEIIAVNKLTGSVGGLELDLGAVLAQLKPVKVAAISRFPGTYRDVALVVRQTVTWSQIKRAINDTKLASPEFLSDYAGADLPPGHRSLAVRLIMVEPDRTLTDQAADERQAKVVVRLNRQFGAKLRS